MPSSTVVTEATLTALGVKNSGAATNAFLTHWCGRRSTSTGGMAERVREKVGSGAVTTRMGARRERARGGARARLYQSARAPGTKFAERIHAASFLQVGRTVGARG